MYCADSFVNPFGFLVFHALILACCFLIVNIFFLIKCGMETKKCSKCGEEKSLGEFVPRKERPGKFYSECRVCYLEIVKTRTRGRKEENLKRIKEELGENCFTCGIKLPEGCMDCHHIYPEDKVGSPKIISNKNKQIEEIKKCILLCQNCHRKYHLLEAENNRFNKKMKQEDASNSSSQKKKKCSKCKKYLLVNFFHKGRQAYCKMCQNSTNTERFRRFKRQCLEYKGGSQCLLCGEDNQAILEFHHANPSEKEFIISKSKSLVFSKDTEKELDKCFVLCSNCHHNVHHIFR